jgi:hypothetical protein
MPLRTFVHRGDEVTAGCRKLQNEGLDNLYSYSGIIVVTKSRRAKFAGQDM